MFRLRLVLCPCDSGHFASKDPRNISNVNTAITMDPSFIWHQRIEHNFDHVHGLLRELGSDLVATWELKAKGGEILCKIESVCKMIEQGDFDKDKIFIPDSV